MIIIITACSLAAARHVNVDPGGFPESDVRSVEHDDFQGSEGTFVAWSTHGDKDCRESVWKQPDLRAVGIQGAAELEASFTCREVKLRPYVTCIGEIIISLLLQM